jgi:AcrR family transcriptional regulator
MARQINEADRLSKRNEILDCAQTLMYIKGFEQMSIQDILSQMGISKGAFYHYFDSKTALLEALVDRTGRQAEVLLQPIIDNPDLLALEKLELFFSSINRWKSAQRDFMLGILKAWYGDENALMRQKIINQSSFLFAGMLNQLILQGIKEGVIHTRYKDMAGAVVFSLMIHMGDTVGITLLEAISDETVDPRESLNQMEQVVNAYTDAIERTLGVTSGSIHLISHDQLAAWLPKHEMNDHLAGQPIDSNRMILEENSK